MKILSWNVNGRTEDAARRQLKAVLRRNPDVIALQEVTAKPFRRNPGSYLIWLGGLLKKGYSVISAVDLLALPYPPPSAYKAPPLPLSWKKQPYDHIKRKNFNLIASRHPIAALPGLSFDDAEEAKPAFPEKHVAGRITVDGVEIDVHNTHLPPGVSRGMLKVHHFEAIRRRVDRSSDKPTILCGDFNAPWSEDANGPVIEGDETWPAEIEKQWIEAEVGVLKHPRLKDVYRQVHPNAKRFPASYYTGRKTLTAHRYDYIFASPELAAMDAST